MEQHCLYISELNPSNVSREESKPVSPLCFCTMTRSHVRIMEHVLVLRSSCLSLDSLCWKRGSRTPASFRTSKVLPSSQTMGSAAALPTAAEFLQCPPDKVSPLSPTGTIEFMNSILFHFEFILPLNLFHLMSYSTNFIEI